MPNDTRRAPLSTEKVRSFVNRAKQDLTNASIDVSPYTSPAFRAACVRNAIEMLEGLERLLLTDAIIEKAKS